MTTALVIAGVVVALLLVGFGLDRLGLWAERKGWVYYRTRRGKGPVNLGLLDQIYQPSMEHVIEEETQERTFGETIESADPNDPDAGDDVPELGEGPR